jgi:hypothetical protein
MKNLSKDTLMWLSLILLTQEDWAWLNLGARGVIFYVFRFAYVILQINNEKKCYISHGFSLH